MESIENKNEYLPLFRKYRPQSFEDVIGQDFTVKALENAIKLNKIANAYLFCGPRGTGKTSCARIFAKSLNCAQGPTTKPCQKCQSCLDVTNAAGIDVIEIDAATNRGIDDAKELISQVQYAPMSGKYKIFIIDEVHMLSKEAFNALLKTFEEPPKNVIFILATTEPHKVIETIVSRCQRFDFRRITIDDITKRLREISDKENIKITNEALFAIAKNVSGGMRDSLALLDQASILGADSEITKDVIESLIGKLTFKSLYELVELVLNGKITDVYSKVEEIYSKGLEPRCFSENLIEFLRNIVIIINSNDIALASDLTLIDKNNIEKIKNNGLFNHNKIIKILDKSIEFYKEIKVATNPYLWAELMLIELCSIDVVSKKVQNSPSIGAIKTPENLKNYDKNEPNKPEVDKKIEPICEEKNIPSLKSEQKPDNNKKNETASVNQPKETLQPECANLEDSAANNENPVEIWAKIINGIESIPAKYFYSGVGKLINISNGHVILGFVNENAISQAKSENKHSPLLKSIVNVLGEKGSVEFITITKDTKILETKAPVSSSFSKKEPPRENFAPKQPVPVSGSFEETKAYSNNNTSEIQDEIDEEETEEISDYTETTREMVETFNGRVIE